MQEYYASMARAPTTLDPFSAIAEPKRRQVLDLLAKGERPVNDLVKALGWPQPQVSKHLGVLRKVGLVSERRAGRQRVYRLNGEQLKPILEWVKNFERFWKHQLERIKARAEQKVQESKSPQGKPPHKQERNQ
jgi:DNA-binding transcriptional ArsR family regulator